MKSLSPDYHRTGWLLALLLALAGCTTQYYRQSADRASYSAIQEKTPLVPNMDQRFTIEQTNTLFLNNFPVFTNEVEYLGTNGFREGGARVFRLKDALDIAVHFSRNYQTHKETLFDSALNLTLARHRFAPIFSASGNVDYVVQNVQVVTLGKDPITGQDVVLSDNIVEQHKVTGSGAIGASWLIRDLGKVTTAFTTDALRFVSGDQSVTTSSDLGATFLRPLLRNAGFKLEKEALIQAERQLLYDLRDFTQFRKDFTVQIATAYYGVLGNRDAARNSYLNLQSSRKNAERARAMVAEGRTTTAELGRLEQQELSSESSWNNAVRTYRQALDNFKLTLGINTDLNIVLDDHELAELEIRHPDISIDDSIQAALVGRLDYQNVRDTFEDTERKVDVAANFLKPQVDLRGSVGMVSNPNSKNRFPLPDPRYNYWSAGLNIDLGLDRVAERNNYRSALISQNSAARAVEEEQDKIKVQVRDSWRTLELAKRNYEISVRGVQIAERRVEEQSLLAELGRARAQDQVDAENALIDSKNQRTQALVTHTIARLQFWNNLGILYIKDNGQWEELRNGKAQ